jgi:hypothetical protein
MASKPKTEMPEPKTAEETAVKNRGLIATIVVGIFGLFSMLFVSMLCSIVLSLVGVTFFWPEEGAAHERKTLAIEMSALANELALVGSGMAKWVDDTISWLLDEWWTAQLIAKGVHWVASFFSNEAWMYAEVALLSMQVFIVRLGVILSSIPIMLLWGLLAITCGLAERDLRRFNAALESSTVFNLALSNLKIPFVLILSLYLSWPTHAYALIATIPVSLGSFLLTYFAIANYKKRL